MLNFALLFFIFAGSLSSCRNSDGIAKTKWLTTEDSELEEIQEESKEYGDQYLIAHIFAKQWDITYFIDPHCTCLQPLEVKTNIEKAIRESIKTWLEPLGGAGNPINPDTSIFSPEEADIVAKINETIAAKGLAGKTIVREENIVITEDKNNYTIESYEDHDVYGTGDMAKRKKGGDALLAFFIYCGKTSVVTSEVGKGEGIFIVNDGYGAAAIHIYLLPHPMSIEAGVNNWDRSHYHNCSPILGENPSIKTGLSLLVILHELGHAFKLLDTSSHEGTVGRREDLAQRKKLKNSNPDITLPAINTNSAIDPRTSKLQPESIMSSSRNYDEANSFPLLFKDDKKGVMAAFAETSEFF